MKADIQELAAANPVTTETGEAWALGSEGERTRGRALEGGLGATDDLTKRRNSRLRWPAAVLGGLVVLLLALPALFFLGDETPQPTTTTVPATTTSVTGNTLPVVEQAFYTALLQCVANRHGTGFGPVMANSHGQVTPEGQVAIDRAAGTGESFSECFADESLRNQSFDLESGKGSILLPPDWVRTTDDLTPNFGDPNERISVGTYPLVPMTVNSDSCALQALVDLSPDDVFVQILERPGSAETFQPRPPTFAGRLSGVDEGDYWECLPPAQRSNISTLRWLSFEDHGHGFYALVALGSDTGEDDLHTVERILDSVNVRSEIEAGWTFTEIPFTIREGSGYAVGGGWLFAWSGSPDRSGDMRRDGVLINIDTGESRTIPAAPIEGRYLPSVIWTGSDFIVFGGHSFTESLVDGAAYDPVAGTWRQIESAKMRPAAFPAAVWTGEEMVVWLAGDDSELTFLPQPMVGQVASYNPATDSWSILNPPELQVVDATLIAPDPDELVLIGGPNMRDLGTVGAGRSIYATTFDPSTETWTEQVMGTETESARAFMLGGEVAALRDDGEIHVLRETGWESLARFPDACWADLAAVTGGTTATYLKFCGINYRFTGTEIVPILGSDEYGSTGNTFGSAFMATEDGRLVVLGDADGDEFASGIVVFGVYDPTMQG